MEQKQDLLNFSRKEIDKIEDENQTPEFSFTFKFPTFDEFCKTQKNFSQLLDFNEHNYSSEISLEDSEVRTSSNGEFVSHDDPREDDFENQECVLEQMMVDSLNLKNVVEVENKEEIYTSSSIGSNNLHSLMNDVNVHPEDGFLSGENKIEEKEDIDTFSEEKLQKVHDESVHSSPDSDMFSIDINDLLSPTFDFHLEDGLLSDEYIDLEFNAEDETEQNNGTQSNFLSENGNEKIVSNDATNKSESLGEHQELFEQLKKEMKKVKAIGLPTILEESESESAPKILEKLKPLKIEEMYQMGGQKMRQVHKFHKSYREKMRKLDIFSCQKMYAIGFLQLKDPLESSSCSISSIPETTTLFTQSLTTNKSNKHENDPTMKFIQELQSDLEIVYVGQTCLSWEILHWQYKMALAIWESDSRGVRRFNDIAAEFQQFHVLMQRFIEDEPFQGPRIQNYVKTRCIYRNLLQVPEIRDDDLQNKKARSEVVYDITSDALVEILEESIRIFWRFVRADKYKRRTPVEFQRPEDLQLFMDLEKDLQKKERKVKQALRIGNGILKKLSCKEDETEDQMLYFFCQVDLKLVSRVLQMSKLTSDQLTWCHNKLSKVSFVNRKIHVEPSFLLFPC